DSTLLLLHSRIWHICPGLGYFDLLCSDDYTCLPYRSAILPCPIPPDPDRDVFIPVSDVFCCPAMDQDGLHPCFHRSDLYTYQWQYSAVALCPDRGQDGEDQPRSSPEIDQEKVAAYRIFPISKYSVERPNPGYRGY